MTTKDESTSFSLCLKSVIGCTIVINFTIKVQKYINVSINGKRVLTQVFIAQVIPNKREQDTEYSLARKIKNLMDNEKNSSAS